MLDPGCGGEDGAVLIHVNADNVQSKVDNDGVLVLVRRGQHRDHVLVVTVQQVSEGSWLSCFTWCKTRFRLSKYKNSFNVKLSLLQHFQ